MVKFVDMFNRLKRKKWEIVQDGPGAFEHLAARIVIK